PRLPAAQPGGESQELGRPEGDSPVSRRAMSAQVESLWNLRAMASADVPHVLEIEKRAYEFPWTEGIFRDCMNVGYSSWIVTGRGGEVLAYALMSMAVGEAHILNLCVE